MNSPIPGASATCIQEGLGAIDWIVIALYGAGMVALGWWYARRQTNIKEYFIAGSGMGPFVIGISQFATLVSTLSYLSTPGEVIAHGPIYVGLILSLPVAYLIVGYLIIPRLMKHRVTSAYAILESKLGLEGRLLGSGLLGRNHRHQRTELSMDHLRCASGQPRSRYRLQPLPGSTRKLACLAGVFRRGGDSTRGVGRVGGIQS